MTAADFSGLEQDLGYKFKKTEFIIEALTHRSHFHEFGDSSHNERLEFLGDAVIDLCVTETLMQLSPDTNEGDLSKLRSQLVSEASLAQAAIGLKLGEFVRLGRGEDLSGGRKREALLADTFEAVAAAVYLDGGLDEARRVVLSQLEGVSNAGLWKESTAKLLSQDFKSRLQEFCQGVALGAPVYRCVETRGPDHKKRFVMGLYIQDKEVIRCEGATKKEATQTAAKLMIERTGSSEKLLDYLESEKLLVKPRPSSAKKKKNSKKHKFVESAKESTAK